MVRASGLFAMTDAKTVALIDLSAIHRRAWHSPRNEDISNAVHDTIAAVHNYAAGCDYVGVCVDRPPYKRREIAADYKANRDKTASAVIDQVRRIEEKLSAEGLHILGAKGYEADDIIAQCAEWASGQGHFVTIFSADKDLMQLVAKQVLVTSTATGEVFDRNAVVAKWGVPPGLVPDFLALVGDKSDNVPGIPGCGPKKASEWLHEFGGLDAILADPEKLPDRFVEVVIEHKAQLSTAWRLVTLMTDAPISPEIIMEAKEKSPEAKAEEVTTIDEPEVIETPTPGVKTESVALVPASAPVQGMTWERSLEPKDSNGALNLAKLLYASRSFVQFSNVETILAVILVGRNHGLDAVASLQGFHSIKNKVSPSAQLLLGLVKKHPTCKFFRLVESTATSATWETQRIGEPEPTRMSYTIEEARAAQLIGNDNWKKRPKTMLRWRCGVELARAVYPDVTAGLYTPDEIEEM